MKTFRTYLQDAEYRTQTHAYDEYQQEDAVQTWVPLGVEDGEEDQSTSSHEGAEYRKARQHSLSPAHFRD